VKPENLIHDVFKVMDWGKKDADMRQLSNKTENFKIPNRDKSLMIIMQYKFCQISTHVPM
jgi:hypothetical protein